MKKFLFALAMVTAALAAAAQATFQVIPPRNVIAGNRFAITYRLTNGEATTPKAPAVQGCKLLTPNPGISTMSSYEMVNGHTTSTYTTDFTYTYRAEKEGTFTIPAASITVDGKTLTTKETKFKVLPPDQAPQGGGSQQGVRVDDLSSQDNGKISKSDVFVRIILNKNHAYEQEAIECTVKLYTKYERINSFSCTNPPTYDGFLIEEIDTQSYLNAVEHYNGQNYITAVLKHCIIYPQKSGKLTINSGTYNLSIVQLERVSNGFFYSARPVEKEVRLDNYSQTVNITPLPEPKPASFNGAVGQFSFDSQMNSTQLRTGEAASLKYIITGTGNIKFVHEPKPEIPSEFEQYTPQVDNRSRVAGSNMTGTMTVDYTIVPQSVGDFKIPAEEFSYFDPSKKKYVTLSAKGFEIKVAKGSGTTTTVEQSTIQAKNTDILHIKTGDPGLSHDHTPMVRFWWYWAIYGVLILALILAIVVGGRRAKLNADVAGRRNARANKVAKKRLRAAEGFMKARESEKFHAELLRAMWGYLSDKLAMPSSQLTRQNIVESLTSKGIEPAVTEKVIAVLDECEMARYTPDSSSDSSMEALYNQATEAINTMEKNKGAKKK